MDDSINLDRRTALKLVGSAAGVGSAAALGGSKTTTARANTGTTAGSGPVGDATYAIEKAKADLAFQTSVKKHYIRQLKSRGECQASYSTTESSGETFCGDSPESVYLGEDESLDPDYGDKYESDDTDSYQDAELKAEYDLGSDTIEAYAWDTAGYGTFLAWAYIGAEFEIKDSSGQQDATITFTPDVTADMGLSGECGNGAKLEGWVEDHTDSEKLDDTVFDYTDYARTWSSSYTDSVNMTLEAGHTYSTVMKITASTTCEANAGSSVSDFTDNDDGSQKVDVGNIQIKF
jgi:hypothetical protein